MSIVYRTDFIRYIFVFAGAILLSLRITHQASKWKAWIEELIRPLNYSLINNSTRSRRYCPAVKMSCVNTISFVIQIYQVMTNGTEKKVIESAVAENDLYLMLHFKKKKMWPLSALNNYWRYCICRS